MQRGKKNHYRQDEINILCYKVHFLQFSVVSTRRVFLFLHVAVAMDNEQEVIEAIEISMTAIEIAGRNMQQLS